MAILHPREVEATSAESGYVMAMTALLIIPMMIFAALAVDVGSWYSRSTQIQRAADAAALAAVVHMPDAGATSTKALQIAQANGFEHGVDDVTVTVTGIGQNRVKVEITAPASSYFGAVVTPGIEITRFGVAEYTLPVPMGSPYNSIGMGTYFDGDPSATSGTPPTNAWAGMMGFCVNPKWGDIRSFAQVGSKCSGGATTNPTGIPLASQSPYHDKGGYLWVIDVPSGMPGNLQVQVYDAGYCTNVPRDAVTNEKLRNGDSGNVHNEFVLYEADGTDLDDTDNPVFATWAPSANTGCDVLTDAPGFVIPNTQPGRWLLRSRFQPNSSTNGQNYFGFNLNRLWTTGGCSTITDATCPGIYARDQLPVRTASFAAGARFFLAEIGPEHAGKKIEVTFWDPGEGMESIQILDPDGVALPFTWTDDNGNNTPTAAVPCRVGNNCLVVGSNVPSYKPFDGVLVTATVDLAPLDLTSYPNNWFSVEYAKLGTKPSVDWTTWGVKIVGDPISLTE